MMPTEQERQNQLSVHELMQHYLERHATAEEGETLNLAGDVVPYSVNVGIPIEPRVAWQEAQAALIALRASKVATPPEWANWVHEAGQVTALAFAAGNYPQDIEDLGPFIDPKPLSRLQPNGVDRGPVTKTTLTWVEQRLKSNQLAELLLAAGVLRQAGSFRQAAEVLKQAKSMAGTEHRSVVMNEEAALLWQEGKCDDALRLWELAGESVVVRFNRGMALLFLDRAAEASEYLRTATEQLPDTSAWHHLAGLYAALAEMRG